MKFIRYYSSEKVTKYINIKLIDRMEFKGEKLRVDTIEGEIIRLKLPGIDIDTLEFDEFLNSDKSVYDNYLQKDDEYTFLP